MHSYKTKTQDKDPGTFWIRPFCSNHVGGTGTRILIYITCYSSIRKGLNRKMGIWYSIQIPIYFAEKDHVHSLYTVHVQNDRSRGNKEGKFQTYVYLVFQATPWFDRKSLRLVSPRKQAKWATPNLNGSTPLTTVTCTPNDHEVPSTALQWRRTNFNGIWVWGIFRSSSSLMTVQQNLT